MIAANGPSVYHREMADPAPSSGPFRVAVSLAIKPPVTVAPPVILINSNAPVAGEDWLREDDEVHLRWSRDVTFATVAGTGAKVFNAGVIGTGSTQGWGWAKSPMAPGAWYFQIRVVRPATGADTGWGGTIAFNDQIPPAFTSPISVNAPENQPASGRLTASEPCQYSIAGGRDGTSFVIDPVSGAWQLVLPDTFNNGLPDFERQSAYHVIFGAKDAAGNVALQDFTLKIENVDDKPTLGDTAFLADINGAVPGGKYTASYTVAGLTPGSSARVWSTLPVMRNGTLMGLTGTANNGDVLTIKADAPASRSTTMAAELRVGEGADHWRINTQRDPSRVPGFSVAGSGRIEPGSAGAPPTFASIAIGPAHPRRIIVVWIAKSHGVPSASISLAPRNAAGAATGTRYAATRAGVAGPPNHMLEAWTALVPDGVTVDITLSDTSTINGVHVSTVWDVNPTPTAVVSSAGAGALPSPHNIAVSTPSEGSGVAGITLCAGYFTGTTPPTASSPVTQLGTRTVGAGLQIVSWSTRAAGRSSPGVNLGYAWHSMLALSFAP